MPLPVSYIAIRFATRRMAAVRTISNRHSSSTGLLPTAGQLVDPLRHSGGGFLRQTITLSLAST